MLVIDGGGNHRRQHGVGYRGTISSLRTYTFKIENISSPPYAHTSPNHKIRHLLFVQI